MKSSRSAALNMVRIKRGVDLARASRRLSTSLTSPGRGCPLFKKPDCISWRTKRTWCRPRSSLNAWRRASLEMVRIGWSAVDRRCRRAAENSQSPKGMARPTFTRSMATKVRKRFTLALPKNRLRVRASYSTIERTLNTRMKSVSPAT